MKHWTLPASTAIALILSAAPSLAITPEEVWENWKALATGTGGTLTVASETRNGDALEVKGVTTTATDAMSGDTFTTTIDSVTLTGRGDGTVEVKMSDSYPLTFTEKDGQPGKPTMLIRISQPGAVVIASGTPEAASYDFTIPTLTAELVEGHNSRGEKADVTFTVTAADLAGKYLVSPREGGGFGLESSVTSGAVKVTAAANENGNSFTGSFDLAGISVTSAGTFIDQALMADMTQALQSGFAIDSKAEIGAIGTSFQMVENGAASSFSGQLGGAGFHAVLDKTKVDYGFSLKDGKFAADMPAAGIPAGDTAFTEVSFAVAMPVGVSDVAGDFSFLTRLTDLTMSESVWGLFDPGAQLARDPASLVVDLKGKGAWLTDIFAQGGGMTETPDMPVRLDSLDLTQVLLKLAAAEVSANGALTFDNSDLQTFQGFPAPEGKVTVNLSGVSALLDKLVAMGFISADDLTGVRMGLAMFARPGAGPDQLVSEIEFRNKGLFVNGQQIM